MQETYADLVECVVDRIEQSLDGILSLDDLSGEAHLSKYHLHRLFRALTGYPLAEYARRRRISASIEPLLGSNHSILDIALDFGFSHEQSYIRAFKSVYGVSPGQCRAEKTLLALTERIRLPNIVPIGEDGALLESNLVARGAMELCGIRHFVTDEDNAANHSVTRLANDFFLNERARIGLDYYHNRYVGLIEYSANPAENWYLTCAELKKKPVGPAPEGMEFASAPSRRYREFLHVSRKKPFDLTWDDVKVMYAHIFGVWMPANGDQLAEARHFEYVDLNNAHDDYAEFRVLLPVREK